MQLRVAPLVVVLLATPLFGDQLKENAAGSERPGTPLVVGNEFGDLVALSADDFAKLKRARIQYEGVPLGEVLRFAGVKVGDIRAPLLSHYVVVEAADGYQVVFSIPEVDPALSHNLVLLADRTDGKPLPPGEGPYEIIEAGAKMHGRWIRNVQKIVVKPAAGPPADDQTRRKARDRGKLYLVGIGPGDPDLVTFKAAKVLKESDRVFCFGYLRDEVARFAREDALTVASPLLMGRYCGRDPAEFDAQTRERVIRSNQELARFVPGVRKLVAEGKTVAFAAAGDPTVFCPWSWVTEEFEDLRPVVVPGLSSFNAASAALKRSITRKSGSVMLSAGEDLGTPDGNGRLNMTLVLFTHSRRLNELVPRLSARYPADTPIVVVCQASYAEQRLIRGTLGTILRELEGKELPHLYLIYVGDGLTDTHKRSGIASPRSLRQPASQGQDKKRGSDF